MTNHKQWKQLDQKSRTTPTAKKSADIRPSGPESMMNRGLGLLSITVRSILYDRKTMAVGVLLLLLLAIPLYWLSDPPSGEDETALDMFMTIIAIFYLQFIVLYVCFLYGTGLITTEIDDRTMTYLLSRPIHRLEILVYKYIGYVFSIFLIFAVPVILNYLILAQHGGSGEIVDNLDVLAISLGGIFIAIMMWGALFIFMASVFKNPLMPGFLYCIFWETFMPLMSGNIPKATITYHIRTFLINGIKVVKSSLVDGGDLPPHGDMSSGWTFILAIVISAVFLFMSWVVVRDKDFH
jgi:ABC-2 type transport system permease protein